MKMLIGIPAYNENETIGKVLSSIPKRFKGIKKTDILVLDDGSSDKTASIAKKENAIVLSHIINRGLGGALKTIFSFTKTNRYDILVTFDSDGQHNPKDVQRLIDPILSGSAEVVIGTRWSAGSRKYRTRYIINWIANIITYFLFGIWTTDSQSGFRAFNRRAIQFINLQTDGMEVSSEIFREIFIHNLKYMEIPIEPVYTDYSRGKGQRIDNAPGVFIKLLLRFLQ